MVDFNDIHTKTGIVAVKEQLLAGLDEWDVLASRGFSAPPPRISRGRPDGVEGPPVPARVGQFKDLTFRESEIADARISPTCIVAQYIYADVGTLIAPGGVGKTTLVIYEAIHIILGLPLWGLDVLKPGRVLIVTAEDRREIFAARLREIMFSMELDEEQRSRVLDGFGVWDVTGQDERLVMVHDGNVILTGLADAIVEAYKEDPPALIVFDPLISFGGSEGLVNDNEQGLITAGRRIVRGLDCSVRYIHHTGKANARGRTVDQYSGRGGSALADGSRMTVVLAYYDPEANQGKPPPDCWGPSPPGSLTMLVRAKMSYAPPNLPIIWIKRDGYSFEYMQELRQAPDVMRQVKADQLLRFLESQFKQNRYHSKNSIEASAEILAMSRKEIRDSLEELIVSQRVSEKRLPPEARTKGRTTFFCPSLFANEVGEQ